MSFKSSIGRLVTKVVATLILLGVAIGSSSANVIALTTITDQAVNEYSAKRDLEIANKPVNLEEENSVMADISESISSSISSLSTFFEDKAKTTIKDEKTLQLGEIKVIVEKDTEIKSGDGKDLLSKDVVLQDLKKEEEKTSFEFGNPDQHLEFNKPVKIEIKTNNPRLEISVAHEGETEASADGLSTDGINFGTKEDKAVLIGSVGGIATFWTKGASTFIINAGGTNAAKLWLRADSGVVATSNVVSAWNDQTANNNNLGQATPARQPLLEASNINFNPSINFDGTDDFLVSDNNINSFDLFGTSGRYNSTYMVWTRDAGNVGLAYGPSSDLSNRYSMDFDRNLYPIGLFTGTANKTKVIDTTPAIDVILNDSNSGFGNSDALFYNNGRANGSIGDINTIGNVNKKFSVGASANGLSQIDGKIAEVIVYNIKHTPSQRNQIESYLAVKYGITLDQTTPTNYVNSANNIIWNAATNTGFDKNITVIGRDTNTTLDQKQSKSVNLEALVTVGNGGIAASNQANTNSIVDTKFLAFGDNNQSLNWTNLGAPTDRKILGRKFKAQTNTSLS
jgi:hypothetical protein